MQRVQCGLDHEYWHQRRRLDVLSMRRGQILHGIERGIVHHLCGRLDHEYGHQRGSHDMHGVCRWSVLDSVECGCVHGMCGGAVLGLVGGGL